MTYITFSTEEKRLQHPQASKIHKGLWYTYEFYYPGLDESLLPLLSASNFAEAFAAAKGVPDVDEKLKQQQVLCIALLPNLLDDEVDLLLEYANDGPALSRETILLTSAQTGKTNLAKRSLQGLDDTSTRALIKAVQIEAFQWACRIGQLETAQWFVAQDSVNLLPSVPATMRQN